MDTATASNDLQYIRQVLDKTHRRIDPHAWHFVWWGGIVLLWYPTHNLLQLDGVSGVLLPLGLLAMAIGITGSGIFEWRMRRRPRLAAENTFIGRQIMIVVYSCVGAASVLSAVGPPTGIVPGPQVPVIWGFSYSVMALGVGVVYSREYLASAAVIFAGAVAAMLFPDFNGLILGPCMGLGLIVPGLIAERRVKRMMVEDESASVA
ncbi:MAG: hypothetical protein ACYTDX_08520 [Planctomycetota bacterium]|jgi:hypothetical protein